HVNDLFGLREEKYQWLDKKTFSKRNYEIEKPSKPFYFLIKTNTKDIENYLQWHNVQNIFPVNSVGIVTARDQFAIDDNCVKLQNRIRQFRDLKIDHQFIS